VGRYRTPTNRASAEPVVKKGLQTSLQAEVAQEIAHLIGRQSVFLLAARAISRGPNADTSDYARAHLPCSCGATARYAGRRTRSFQTALGPLE
jgi:hypothetical protein